jgi:hypothetical protein
MRCCILFVLVVGCACGTSHSLDAGADAPLSDAEDAGRVCVRMPPRGTDCATFEAECAAWVRSVAPDGTTVFPHCYYPGIGPPALCTSGTSRGGSPAGGESWLCSLTVICGPGTICVADSPSSEPYCAEMCPWLTDG